MKNRVFVNTDTIESSYCYDATPPSSLDTQHCHDTYEILYIVSGRGEYLVEGASYEIKPGTLMLIRPFVYHSVRLNEDEPYARYLVNFSPKGLLTDAVGLLDKMLEENGDGAGGRYYSAGVLSPAVSTVFERFESTIPMHQSNRCIYAKTLISELIVLLSLATGEEMYQDDAELGARVIKYLNDNIDRNITLDQLAKRFFVSKYYLCRAFKKHNGISIHGYITRKRVMYAKQLIDSGVTASVAAYRVGFGDYSSFYRAYVKIVGKAPTAP